MFSIPSATQTKQKKVSEKGGSANAHHLRVEKAPEPLWAYHGSQRTVQKRGGAGEVDAGPEGGRRDGFGEAGARGIGSVAQDERADAGHFACGLEKDVSKYTALYQRRRGFG